jgi:hypothetical protein
VKLLGAVGSPNPRPTVEEHAELCAKVATDRDAEAERKREAEAERQRVAAAKAAEAARAVRRTSVTTRSSSSGYLRCNDGTRSPTCTCGGSHRGCCSYHGGVAGFM